MKRILIFINILMMLIVVGCGQSGDRASGGAVCTISDFTTEIHEYIRPALGHDANFFSFTVEPGDFYFDVGYAVIEEGVFIGEAMSDPDMSDNPFQLIFYVSAVSGD